MSNQLKEQPRRRDRHGSDTRSRQRRTSVARSGQGELVAVAGVLELHLQGYGFLRDQAKSCLPSSTDTFVPAPLIDGLGLRVGNHVKGTARQSSGSNGPRMEEVVEIDGRTPEENRTVRDFESLTPVIPHDRLRLETGTHPLSTRVMDLLAPLGKGQRGLIVAPPRTGKTVLLQQIGNAIAKNHPEMKLMVLLIDERPEEVTEMRRSIRGEVLASSLDCDIESHVRLSRLVIERCKRLAERGHDVVLLVDSITRMARAFNKWTSNSGRTMSGGVDVKALDIPKSLFASARAFEEGGSLTILATALIDTGSRMDEVIFQEFKGTGNMELVLDRRLADRRVWPAVDITRSGTRHEERLLDPESLYAVTMLRRTLSGTHPVEAMERLTSKLARFGSNAELLRLICGAEAVAA